LAAKAAWYTQRRAYQQLRRRECAEFWRGKIEANESDPRQLWRVVDTLLGRGRLPPSSAIDVEVLNRYFAEKVAKVRSCTSDAPPAAFSHVQPGASFQHFSQLTTDDVIAAIRRLPDKQSAADPIPTTMLKQIADVLAPYITQLFNRSLIGGHFPAVFK